MAIHQHSADSALRGLTAYALLKCSLWRNGPVFLQRSEQEWPRIPLTSTLIEPNDPEVKKERITVIIRMIKRILLSITRQQNLDDESLETVMCEVEAILNNRPLATTSGDPNDLEPLTPNHLIQLKVQPI